MRWARQYKEEYMIIKEELNLVSEWDKTFPKSDKVDYCYESRPFILDKFEEGKFIPLVFFASFWVDEKYGFLRFCGAQEISSTMESDYIENTPHFYVIGVEIQKMSAK